MSIINLHDQINFSLKKEIDCSLPFLDTLIQWNDTKVLMQNDYNKQIITKVHRNIEKRNHSNGQDKVDEEYDS